jgi:hypothetical protein
MADGLDRGRKPIPSIAIPIAIAIAISVTTECGIASDVGMPTFCCSPYFSLPSVVRGRGVVR